LLTGPGDFWPHDRRLEPGKEGWFPEFSGSASRIHVHL
jgi:hypothetical protein